MHKFWAFRAAKDNAPAELQLYGEISDATWWGDEVTPKQFAADLKALGAIDTLHVRINSPGGDVFAANTIVNLLRNHGAEIVTFADGLVASAATLIYAAGTKRVAAFNALFMYHSPWTVAMGNAQDLRAMAEALDKAREGMLDLYESASSLSREELIAALDAETWYTAKEAAEVGFVTDVEEAQKVAACLSGGGLLVNGLTVDAARIPHLPLSKVASMLHEHTPESSTGDADTAEVPAGGAAEDANAKIRQFFVKEYLNEQF